MIGLGFSCAEPQWALVLQSKFNAARSGIANDAEPGNRVCMPEAMNSGLKAQFNTLSGNCMATRGSANQN